MRFQHLMGKHDEIGSFLTFLNEKLDDEIAFSNVRTALIPWIFIFDTWIQVDR